MNAILVGRHAGDVPGFQIIEQRSVTFALSPTEAFRQLEELLLDAHRAGAVLLLQNAPAILAATIFKYAALFHTSDLYSPMGIIISVPGERHAGVSREFSCDNPMDLNTIEAAVKFVNSRAKVKSLGTYTLEITVDPVTEFVFSHIEWLIPPKD